MFALEVSNLTKKYSNGVKALRGINLSVAKGDFFALLGPNGAGKSTAIGIITSLVTKTDGQVKVFGNELDQDLSAVKSCIGLVPQEFNFNQFEKVIDIVTNQGGYYGISRDLSLKRAEKYLRKLELWNKRNEISRNLSGGMKRRLMIARALVHEPKMLILDEPTAGVDIEIRRSTWEFLRGLNQEGTTIILTTHYLEEAEYLCKGIGIIDKGEILASTTVRQLLSRMQQETFVLDCRQDILTLPKIADCQIIQKDTNTLEISIPKSININTIFSQLSAHGLEITSLRNKANRLEELFVNLINVTRK